MRGVLLMTIALSLGGCQLLTNFVRPLVDPVDAGVEDGGEDALIEDALVEDALLEDDSP